MCPHPVLPEFLTFSLIFSGQTRIPIRVFSLEIFINNLAPVGQTLPPWVKWQKHIISPTFFFASLLTSFFRICWVNFCPLCICMIFVRATPAACTMNFLEVHGCWRWGPTLATMTGQEVAVRFGNVLRHLSFPEAQGGTKRLQQGSLSLLHRGSGWRRRTHWCGKEEGHVGLSGMFFSAGTGLAEGQEIKGPQWKGESYSHRALKGPRPVVTSF